MSDIFLSFILGIIQGLTEFLPISSSAHLLFPSLLFGTNDLGLYFDISVHAGSLVAVIYYFKNSIFLMGRSLFVDFKRSNKNKDLAFQLIIATLPIIVAGIFFKDLIEQRIFDTYTIATANLFFAAVLFFAFVRNKSNKDLMNITLYSALFIGIFQCFALIPGASRSGTAITAALLIGLNLKDASKFAFLLSIPTILGALFLLSFDLKTEVVELNVMNIIIGFFTSMIFAFFTIKLFLKIIEKIGMIPFITYRVLLGVFLILM